MQDSNVGTHAINDGSGTAHSEATRQKRSILLLLVAWLVASASFWGIRCVELPLLRGPDGVWAMAEADAYVRMYLVRNVVEHGAPIRQRFVQADNAPFGRINEWTSPTTLAGVLLTRVARRVTGWPVEHAMRFGMLALGPIAGWAALSLLGWGGYRLRGWTLAFCWMLPMALSPDVLTITRFGNADHHSLHMFLFVAAALWMLVSERRQTVWAGGVLGVLNGVALWSAGSELLPLVALTGAQAFLEQFQHTDEDERIRRYWRGWYTVGLGTTLAALLYEFYPRPLHDQLEMLSPAHVLLWAVMGWIIEQAGRRRPRWVLGLHMVAGMGVMILALGLLKHGQWDKIHIFQGEFFQREASITREFEPWAKTVPEWLRAVWAQFGVLPLFWCLAAFSFGRHTARVRWLLAAGALYVLLAILQIRWLDFAAPLLIMGAGLGAVDAFGKRAAWAPVCVSLCVAPLLAAPVSLYRQIAAAPREALIGPFHEAFALEAAARCLEGAEENGEQPIVLAPWFQGSVLIGSGKVRAIASPYWSNGHGLRDGARLFATRSAAEFEAGLEARRVTHILLPDRERTARAISQSWILVYGYPPTWEELQQTVIWRIASRKETPFISCEDMRRIRPDWRVISVSQLRAAGYLRGPGVSRPAGIGTTVRSTHGGPFSER